MDHSLSELIGMTGGNKIAFIGCGGKTSVINKLALENGEKKVLVTTTTKIRVPLTNYHKLILSDKECREYEPERGINYLGIRAGQRGKMTSLSDQTLDQVVSRYDLVLIESDGSKGFPLKGWEDYEPVIPGFISQTVGIVTLNGVGKPADEDNVHRLPIYLKLTDMKEGDIVILDDVAKMITEKSGMFKNGKGSYILIVNQIESRDDFVKANRLCRLIMERDSKLIQTFIIGSVKLDQWFLFKDI